MSLVASPDVGTISPVSSSSKNTATHLHNGIPPAYFPPEAPFTFQSPPPIQSFSETPSLRSSAPPVRQPDFVSWNPQVGNGYFMAHGSHGPMMSASPVARPRNMSQSSTDREAKDGLTQVTSPALSDPKHNPKKRPSTDPIDYPRRRATIACEICRSRKSRCDGQRPKCRLCSELNAECVYREPGIKLDAGDKLILEHLNRIEGLLQSGLGGRANSFSVAPSLSPPLTNGITDDAGPRRPSTLSTFGASASNGMKTFHTTSNISTMPKTHTTPALNLLQWPMIRDLVSRPYDPQVLLQLEMAREPLHLPPVRTIDLTNAAAYIGAFFERVNVWYACVNPFSWTRVHHVALAQGFQEGPESCIVLLVLALGCAECAGSMSRQPLDQDPPGIQYFAAAWALLPSMMLRNNVMAAQCHILAAAYLFYVVRPLEAWNLLTNTSMKLQLLLSGSRLSHHAKVLTERVYWNTLLFESDLLAELDLPHSGIVQFEESVGLPGGFEDDGDEPVGKDELWYFLAQIALRRLLNRVSHLIYSQSSAMKSPSSLDAVAAELDFQLTQWYNGLPPAVRFPQGINPGMAIASPVQTVLRLRYYACRTIIFRPYIQAVLNDESAAIDPSVQENCRKCLEACIRQLEHITAHHAGHLPYLWQGALSIVSQALLIMGATMSPSLSALLPPPEQMDDMIEEVIREIERYAALAPSIRLSAEILREAENRRRVFLRPPAAAPLKV